MKISKQQLIELTACEDGLARFIEQTGNTDEPVDVLSLIGGKNIISDLLWLAGETLPKEKIVRFACDVALINIEKMKPYTTETGYDLIVDFLNNPTADTIDADAADAYADAADAAVAYAAVAYAADADAVADVAAVTVAAAAAAAAAAIDTVAYAATYAATQEQVNELLVKLFEEC